MGLINFRIGGRGRRTYVGTVTLVDGAGEANVPFKKVDAVYISQNQETAVAHGHSWTASSGTITFDSSDGADTSVLSFIAVGY